jgi:hypothetical protein
MHVRTQDPTIARLDELARQGAHRPVVKEISHQPRVYKAQCPRCTWSTPGNKTMYPEMLTHAEGTLPTIRPASSGPVSTIQEVEPQLPKLDLATAIVGLARSAEQRRGARADLIEATDTVAAAIRKQLRNGDEVVVARLEATLPPPKDKSVDYTAASAGRLRWSTSDVARHPEISEAHDVLLRGRAVLGLEKASGRYITDDQLDELREAVRVADEAARTKEPYDEVYIDDYLCHPGTPEEREAFVREAPDVIEAFRELLEEQAKAFDETVRRATKLIPR